MQDERASAPLFASLSWASQGLGGGYRKEAALFVVRLPCAERMNEIGIASPTTPPSPEKPTRSTMNINCPHCQQTLECDESLAGTSVACPVCGKSIDIPAAPIIRIVKPSENNVAVHQEGRSSDGATSDAAERAKAAASKVGETFAKAVGVEKLEGFSLKALFSEVFKKHAEEEVETAFTCGTPDTTPPLESVDSSWPRPWIRPAT